ncbi:putative RNA methyltransferase At5g10620 isoform X2 [Physcomitrium patens]|uniref:putative RNA methyltransferase At5g10620 isoform X2 n=1 Tax=Physcomitrium patens TaxID=3218 RepID=UPI000D156AF5|nr:putative RNA methyltransferase At5g10620 isoform X2 [Physcomitrium patens]|eukprot:XP_024386765.1 putative RNA methyltransferase At5g10620 isoform X2 [Physcomitrella patens]
MVALVQQPPWRLSVYAARRDHVQQNQQTRFPRATRPMPMKLVTVGKDRGAALENVALEYIKKIQRYCPFEEVQLRPNPKNSSDVPTQVSSEGERVMRSISTKDWGASAIVFCIGGPFGHGPQVRERANVSVKLSTMVLNHQIAFLVLLEQIYRAWTILRGEKYHH